jgi:ribosomal-protein-alanine N-acetyltransferase
MGQDQRVIEGGGEAQSMVGDAAAAVPDGAPVASVATRLVSIDDVPELTALAIANREFLAPWSPSAPQRAFSQAGQAELVDDALVGHGLGRSLPHVIVEGDRIIGRITLNSIIRGAFQSASIGYWVAQADCGRGVATAAVEALVRIGFDDLGLHRIQGETLVHNAASRRVLERTGFVEYGFAPTYLRIDGRWQDHVLYQRINPGWEPTL